MKTGTVTSMPRRMFQLSPIHPTKGNASSPGMAQSEAIEKPVARALGGIASDSAVNKPGTMTAKEAEIRHATAIASGRVGARANRASSPADRRRTPRRS